MGAQAQQELNNLWMGGYGGFSTSPIMGGVDLEFLSGVRVVSAVDREISYYRTNTNITDAAGQLLFSTNGAYLANDTGEQMLNGGGLNPSSYTSQYPDGLHLSQGCLILPKPDHPGIYYLLHGTVDGASDASGH